MGDIDDKGAELLDQLRAWVLTNEWEDRYSEWSVEFYGEAVELTGLELGDLGDSLADDDFVMAEIACFEEFVTNNFEGLGCPIDLFVAQADLSEQERAILAALKTSRMGLFVISASDGTRVQFASELDEDQSIWVEDDELGPDAPLGLSVAARLYQLDGVWRSTSLLVLSPDSVSEIKFSLDDEYKAAVNRVPKMLRKDEATLTGIRKSLRRRVPALAIAHWIREEIEESLETEMVTDIPVVRLRYGIPPDLKNAEEIVAGHPDIEADPKPHCYALRGAEYSRLPIGIEFVEGHLYCIAFNPAQEQQLCDWLKETFSGALLGPEREETTMRTLLGWSDDDGENDDRED